MALVAIDALQLGHHLVGALEALRCAITQFGQLKKLQKVCGLVHLTAKVAIFKVEYKDFSLQKGTRPVGSVLRQTTGAEETEQKTGEQ